MNRVCLLPAFTVVVIFMWESLAAEAPWQCPPGSALNPGRNGCLECGDGTFMDRFNREDSCWHCAVCSGMRDTFSPCNKSANTLCRCPDGYYENSDGCTPKVGNSIADNCTLLLERIEKSVEELQQTLNGTAELALLRDVLSEVRMVKNSLASVNREAISTSSTQNRTSTMFHELTYDLKLVFGFQLTVFFLVIFLLIWKLIKNLRYKLCKSRSKGETVSISCKLLMDHVELVINRVRQSLNNNTTAIQLKSVLSIVRDVKCMLTDDGTSCCRKVAARSRIRSNGTGAKKDSGKSSDAEVATPAESSPLVDKEADSSTKSYTILLRNISTSVETVWQSLTDRVNADLLEVVLTEIRIVERMMTSAHSTDNAVVTSQQDTQSANRQDDGTDEAERNKWSKDLALLIEDLKKAAADLKEMSTKHATAREDFINDVAEKNTTFLEKLTMAIKPFETATKAAGATGGETSASFAAITTDKAQLALARIPVAMSQVAPSLCGTDALTGSPKVVTDGNTASQLGEADNTEGATPGVSATHTTSTNREAPDTEAITATAASSVERLLSGSASAIGLPMSARHCATQTENDANQSGQIDHTKASIAKATKATGATGVEIPSTLEASAADTNRSSEAR